jgi:hypothetical protein
MCVADTSSQKKLFENIPFKMSTSNSCQYSINPDNFKECFDERYKEFNDYFNFKRDLTDPRCIVYSKRGITALWLDPLDDSERESLNPVKMRITFMMEAYDAPLYASLGMVGVFLTFLVLQFPLRKRCRDPGLNKDDHLSNSNAVKP